MDILYTPYEVIDELWKNQIEMEKICMLERVDLKDLKEMLTDFALYYGENDRLPIKRPNAFWAFHRWIRNPRRKEFDNKNDGPLGRIVL